MDLTAGTEQLLQILIIISMVLLVPVAVGLVVVLFKLAFLIHSAQDFMRFATGELAPMMKEARNLLIHLETIGHQASTGMLELGNALHQAAPAMRKGAEQVSAGAKSLLSGINRSFQGPPSSP